MIVSTSRIRDSRAPTVPSLLLTMVFIAMAVALGTAKAAPAPDFLFAGARGKLSSLKSLRGQPVVLVIVPGPESKPLRQQAERLERDYRKLAESGTVFFAAFTASEGRVPSDIPFAIATDGPRVATDYGAVGESGFLIVVIGPQGEIKARSGEVEEGEWVRSAIEGPGENAEP